MHEGLHTPSPTVANQKDNTSRTQSTESKSNPLPPDLADFARRIKQLADLFREQEGASYQIDHYQIFELIGEGGQGIVFRARDTVLQRDVALKIPHIQKLTDTKLVQRLIREAQSLSKLEHPHILPIYDGGESNGLPYLVCGFCPGGILTSWLKEHGPAVPPRTAMSWVCQLALAVDHAHRHGIVHRDIKPNNVFLYPQIPANSDDQGLTLKLGDFGLAKMMDDALGDESWTLTQDRLGTPGYMAPEQITGQHHLLGPATDIYSLGVLLFELLTGTVPFTKATAVWQGLGEPPSLRKLNPSIAPELEAICHKCLANDPAHRYPSVKELYDDLQSLLKGERANVQPDSFWRTLSRRVLQNKIPGLLSACILALLIALFVSSNETPPSQIFFPSQQAECNEVWDVKFSPQGDYLVAAGDTGNDDDTIDVTEYVTVVDMVSQQVSLTFPTSHIAMIKHIAIVDQGATLITSSFDGTVQEWDLKTGKPRYEEPIIQLPQVKHQGVWVDCSISAMTVSRDDQWIAIATKDYDSCETMILIYQRGTGKTLKLSNVHNCKITQLIFPERENPTHVLFTTTMHNQLFRWDFSQPKAEPIWKVEKAIQYVAFSPHADRIAFAMLNNDIKIYEWPSRKELTTLKGHQHDIRKVVYSPNNQWLASADINGTVIWWDLTKEPGVKQGSYDRHVQIDALAFSPDGKWLAVGRKDGIIDVFSSLSIPR